MNTHRKINRWTVSSHLASYLPRISCEGTDSPQAHGQTSLVVQRTVQCWIPVGTNTSSVRYTALLSFFALYCTKLAAGNTAAWTRKIYTCNSGKHACAVVLPAGQATAARRPGDLAPLENHWSRLRRTNPEPHQSHVCNTLQCSHQRHFSLTGSYAIYGPILCTYSYSLVPIQVQCLPGYEDYKYLLEHFQSSITKWKAWFSYMNNVGMKMKPLIVSMETVKLQTGIRPASANHLGKKRTRWVFIAL